MLMFICDQDGDNKGVFYSLKEAKQHLQQVGGGSISLVNVSVTKETIRRLLANQGGYANSFSFVCNVNPQE